MAKRFTLRISRVIFSFQSCSSKDPSSLPEDPVPSFLPLSSSPVNPHPQLTINVDFQPTPPPPPKPHRSSFKRHVSSAFTSVGCGLGSKSGSHYPSDHDCTESHSPPEFKWRKEEKWHVVAKIYDDTPRQKIYNTSASENDDVFPSPPPPPPPTAEKKKRRNKKKNRLRLSTSSADSGIFSSESWDEREDEFGTEETETLVSSSRSFSTDSSSIRETPISRNSKKKKKKKKNKKRGKNRAKRSVSKWVSLSPENRSPARLSVFKRLIPCTVEGKVRESFAIVKKSDDPFGDFKRSMMEMIVEKQMLEERELEQLLQCFLSLNSRNHHGVIVEAFSEIWESMFGRASSTHQIDLKLL